MRGSPVERFFAKVEITEGCWVWKASKKLGYGCFGNPKKPGSMPAHRFSYELANGPIPKGLHLDHLCRNPACVRPSHLEAVTQLENMRRGFAPAAINYRKTHCHRGHELAAENLTIEKGGRRRCVSCRRFLRGNQQPRKFRR